MMDDTKQIIENLQAENARLQARIAELEQEKITEYQRFHECEWLWKLHQLDRLYHIKHLIGAIESIAPQYMMDNAKLKARITELESQLNQANTTPAIKHTNTALQALHDVLVTHWQDYDPTNETTKPKQEYIERWIMDNYPELNQSKARWIDKIIRHGTHD